MSPAPWPQSPPSAAHRAAYADAEPRSYWLDRLTPREPAAALHGDIDAELCIVGAGFTGLWAALRDAGRDVVVLEAQTAGFGASGRNGGFANASLTHGLENGAARFEDELPVLEEQATANFSELRADLDAHGIDCAFEATGELTVALEPHEEAWLDEGAEALRRFGHVVTRFDGPAMRAEIASPTYRGGLWTHTGAAVLDPGALAEGLRAAAVRGGARLFEHTPALGLEPGARDRVVVRTPHGRVRARRVLLATSAYPPLVRAVRRYVVPVYDHVLVTEPLSPARRDAVGWSNRQGVSDSANRFHYYRLTADDRILWGGYDALYRPGGPVDDRYDDHDPTFARLSQHFFTTFPQLEGLRFTHRWGGAIDTCSRFSVFFGTTMGGRVAYAAGYTGLGVAASRWGAHVALDLLEGRETEATRLRYVRRRPVPFPPEPLRTAVVRLTQNRLAAADRDGGRRGAWLRTLDALGLGFDS